MSGIIRITARQAEVWVYSAVVCNKIQDNLGVMRSLVKDDSECKHKGDMKGQTQYEANA